MSLNPPPPQNTVASFNDFISLNKFKEFKFLIQRIEQNLDKSAYGYVVVTLTNSKIQYVLHIK